MPDYMSTACRVGDHQTCQAGRLIPDCSCSCHWEEATTRTTRVHRFDEISDIPLG